MKVPETTMLLMLAAGCAGGKSETTDTTAAALPQAAVEAPAVMIVSPSEGDTTGPDVLIVLSQRGIAIAKASGTREEGVGHYHLAVDTAATVDGAVIPPTSTRTIHIGSGDSTFTLKGLRPGPHEVIAVLGYGDHVAMAAARDTVHFVVRR